MKPPSSAWERSRPSATLPEGEVHVWRVAAQEGEAAWRELMRPDERERLGRFRFPEDARREAAGRGALRLLLGAYLDREPGRVELAAGPRGKPRLADGAGGIEFNLAHSGEWALLAFVRGRRIGVDVERWREVGAAAIAGDFFTGEETAQWRSWPPERSTEGFFGAWTLKEAYLKALGEGLAKPLHSFRVHNPPEGEPALAWCSDEPEAGGRWSLARLAVAPEYSAALAVEDPGKKIERVVTRSIAPSEG